MNLRFSLRYQLIVFAIVISAVVMISEADKQNKYSKKANQAETEDVYSDLR
jgi:hypothetical protein